MYNAEQKVFIFITFNRKVVFPRDVDLTSPDSFVKTIEHQLKRRKFRHAISEQTVSAVERSQDIVDMIDRFGGKFLGFRHDICESTVIVEASFPDDTSTVNFTECCSSYPSFSGRYALTMTFDGALPQKIYHQDYSHYSVIIDMLSEAANSTNDESTKIFYLNMASLFEFMRNNRYKKVIRDIRVDDGKTEIDVAFKDRNKLINFADQMFHWFA